MILPTLEQHGMIPGGQVMDGKLPKGSLSKETGDPGGHYMPLAPLQAPNTFTTDGLRPGLYLITIKSSALHKGKGLFYHIRRGTNLQ